MAAVKEKVSSCIACGGATAPWLHCPIDAKKDADTPYGNVQRCKNCGLGAVVPLPAASEIAGFYVLPAYYTQGESHMAPRPSGLLDKVLVKAAWSADRGRPFDAAEVAKSLPAGGRICDLGCGHAEYLRQFKALGFDVIGVDPDPTAREQAADAGVRVIDGTGESIPDELTGAQFDLVIMTHSLEHCLNPVAALANAFSLVRPGGLFYCEVPNSACDHFLTFNVCSEMFDAPRHLYFFPPETLEAMLTKAGFVTREFRYWGFTRQHNPSWRGWETEIHDRIKQREPAHPAIAHTLGRSVALLAKTAFAEDRAKYDSVGILAERPVD